MRALPFVLVAATAVSGISVAPCARAQESFGAIVVRPEPPPPAAPPSPGSGVLVRRRPARIAGGSVLASAGIAAVVAGAVWLADLTRPAPGCTNAMGGEGLGCALGGLGKIPLETAASFVILAGLGTMGGGAALIVSGAKPVPRVLPQVSVAPRAATLRWTF